MTIATDVVAKLQDSSNATFTSVTTEVTEALREFSLHKPREVTETLHAVASSRLVDITPIDEDDLIYGYDEMSFDSMYGVEYKIDQWNNGHREFRNFNVVRDGDAAYIEMVLDNAPSASDENVKVRTYQLWTESTLPSGYYGIVVTYAAGLAASNYHIKATNDFKQGNDEFNATIDALVETDDFINEAINELDSGRALIGDEKDEAVNAFDAAVDRIDAIVTSINTAEEYYNMANLGQPELEHLRSAAEQARALSSSLALAQGRLSLEGIPGSYRQQVSVDLQAANVILGKVRSYSDLFKMKLQNIQLSDRYAILGDKLKAEALFEMRKYTIDYPTRIWDSD